MIKILILFAIIALITAVGVMLSGGKKRRAEVFGQFYEYNERLLLSLKFGREDMKKLAEPFGYVGRALGGDRVLEGEDGEFLSAYIKELGGTDAQSQIDYLNERKAYLRKFRDDSLADYKKYRSVYVRIAFMLGVLTAVLLA